MPTTRRIAAGMDPCLERAELRMDDTRTDPSPQNDRLRLAPINNEEYDALADLFLGDGGYAPESIDSSCDSAGDLASELAGGSISELNADETERAQRDERDDLEIEESPVSHETHTPVLHLTRHEEDAELVGHVSPAEMMPIDVQIDGLRVLETLDATDERASALLAELLAEHERAGGADQADDFAQSVQGDESAEMIAMPHPTIEVVLLGHLPVRATLWARQYACSRAKELGETVGLIRAASGSTSIDLIAEGGQIIDQRFTHLEHALESVSDQTDRVVLRVDEASEPELLDRPEVELITILTGADEAAVVASYRLVKTLDATLGEQYGDDEGPMIRVAVMGASEEQASDAREKLENAAEAFIERPIEIVVGSARIDATGTSNIFREAKAHPPSHIINGLVNAAIHDAQRDVVQDEFDQEARFEIETAEAMLQADRSVEQTDDWIVEPKLSARPTPPIVEFPGGGVRVPEGLTNGAGAAQAGGHGSKDAPTLRDGLCAMIPGLTSIEARCPKAPGVELARDQEGRLHLIACDDRANDAMNSLLATQTWVRNNLGLLLRAEPDLALPSTDRSDETDAMMHLISIEPRSLREIYDTNVCVYALARVQVGKVIAQIATPIN